MANFNVMVAAFCVAGLTLVFALAYNIGGTAEETRSMKMGTITRTRLESARERLTLCLNNKRDAENGRVNKESIRTFLQNTNDLLFSENKMFKEQNQEGLKLQQECLKHLDDLREEYTGTKVSNSSEHIEHLEEERHRLSEAIARANSTKEISREKLRKMIIAYRLEVESLSRVLAARQQRAIRAARQQVAEAACDPKNPYSIMMDAGSTGSRTHIIHFNTTNEGKLTLVGEVFEQVKPGLSSYADDPEGAARSLKPLMDAAVKAVPLAQQKCTSIALKATAGLRLLGDEKSRAILESVLALFAKYPFAVGSNAVEVMDGKDEGPYAWLTVNFLLENLAPNRSTAAILDMGGGSTQVVFQPNSPSVLEDAPEENIYKTSIRGLNLMAYQHSYLGLGLKEAGKAILKVGAATPDADFACLPPGHEETVDGVVVKNAKAANFDECALVVARHVVRRHDDCLRRPCGFNGVYQPNFNEAFTGDIYAFSYFFDRMESFLPLSGIVTVGSYKEIGQKICAGVEKPYKDFSHGTMCMDFAFLYTILHKGYGLDDDRKLFIKKKINDVETAWPLGAALAEMS